ncbi:MAG: hypothetical protein ACNS62_17255 [Candidatus Cyclobacteriaceae bacterium M3_2C_046]
MKRFALFLVTIFSALSFSAIANGTDEQNASLSSVNISHNTKLNAIEILYTPSSNSRAKVKFYDAHNNMILNENIKTSASTLKRYMLDLEDGAYKVELQDQTGLYSKTFLKEGSQVTETDAFSISLYRQDEKVRLLVAGDQVKPVNVAIYNHNNQVIMKDRINYKGNFTRVYDLSNINSHVIMFEVYDKDHLFFKRVK